MRTLIFGAKGQLGRDLLEVMSRAGEVRGYDLPEADITDEPGIFSIVEDFAPDVLINAAAYTNVEAAEDNLGEAFRVNETGARHLADIAARRNIPVVYYSTDFVFDGRANRPYQPDDAPSPLSVYGRSKLAGERATAKENPRHFILRTAWLYGPGGNNFVEKMLTLARQHPLLRVVTDEVGSPTHTLDLAEATLAMVQTKAYGTYHAANVGAASRFEFAQQIFGLAGVDTPLEPCIGAEFPAKARRPAYGALDCSSLTAACGYRMRPWQDALAHYMERRAR
jgi:dTDP-4-dehydrorhamnose reductase